MWREVLAPYASRLDLRPGANAADMDAAEQRLAHSLPDDERSFLAYTNGFYERDAQYEYAWSLAEVARQNQVGWGEGWLPTDLLAVGGDGAGGYFALALDGGTSVLHYSSLADERTDLGLTLVDFWSRWLDGTISV